MSSADNRFRVKSAESLYGMADFNPMRANSKNMREFFERVYEGRESIGL